ncbi:MAG: tRNA (uracil-5-)-methyltransferase [Clostridia bacterium]|nr:tRNA (uracil-5-)-methyltransferase [Clostridia bacterium]
MTNKARKRRRNKRRSHFPTALFIILPVIAIGIAAWFIFFKPMQDSVVVLNQSTETVEAAPVEKTESSISIPGFEGLSLKAGEKKQSVALKNPEQNPCYFVITLVLDDGTVLWESDYIAPGEISKPITLNQPLEAGTYPNSILRYSCFTLDKNRSPLNGAETKLTLRVKE